MTVVITRGDPAAERSAGPAVIAPVRADDGRPVDLLPLAAEQSSRWTPEAQPEGPLSLLLSTRDRRLVVLRNGLEIGRAAVSLHLPEPVTGTHAFVRCDGDVDGSFAAYPDGRAPAWLAIGLPGHEDDAGRRVSREDIDGVAIPPLFAAQVVPLLDPGTVLVVTDAALAPHTTGVPVRVVDAAGPA